MEMHGLYSDELLMHLIHDLLKENEIRDKKFTIKLNMAKALYAHFIKYPTILAHIEKRNKKKEK